jgi:hypothetical protein
LKLSCDYLHLFDGYVELKVLSRRHLNAK